MNYNKIAEKLLKILNKEITQIELSVPTFTEDAILEFENNEKQISSNSTITIPVSNNGYIPVLILFASFTEMNSLKVKSILSNAKIKYIYDIIPAMAVDATDEQILELSELAYVELLSFDDYAVGNLETARKWFEIDKVVDKFKVTGHEGYSKAFTKKDNVIAILDTGIDIHHVDLGSGKVIGWHDEVNPGTIEPYDDHGHGTHVASIAAGLGKAIWDYRGVAFGAALVGVKVLDSNNFGSYSQIIAGIQWCVNNRSTYGIRIINMSIGGPGDAVVRAATNAAINSGIVVVCAAGNDGPGLNTVGSPGDTPACITVGNMADVGQYGYFLVPSSSRGPIFDGSVKPDVVAPGYYITAAKAGTTNQYSVKTGTSMACPFVAGLVALMLDADRTLTPSQVKQLIVETAELWGFPDPNNDYGHGKLMPYKVLSRINKKHSHKCSHKCDCHFEDKCSNDEQPNHFSINKTLTQPNVNDWYEFYVDTLGFPVTLTLITNTPLAEAKISVYDANYIPVDSITIGSINSNRSVAITFLPNRYGKYLVKIERLNVTSLNYQLDLSVFGYGFRWFASN